MPRLQSPPPAKRVLLSYETPDMIGITQFFALPNQSLAKTDEGQMVDDNMLAKLVKEVVVQQQIMLLWIFVQGTAIPRNNIAVKPRVAAPLQSANFHEGLEVKALHELATIAPLPFAILMDQTKLLRVQALGGGWKIPTSLQVGSTN